MPLQLQRGLGIVWPDLVLIPEAGSSPTDTVDHETAVICRGSASLQAGETATLNPITEFGANAYTEEEEKSLLEIIEAFNGRHGTTFSREDFLRFERVNQEIMDEDMKDKMRNNPADVVYGAFSKAFLHGMIRMFQTDRDMQNIVMTDMVAREQATRHFFKRAQGMV